MVNVIKNAPFLFALSIVIITAAVWFLTDRHYRPLINAKNAEISAREAEVKATTDKISRKLHEANEIAKELEIRLYNAGLQDKIMLKSCVGQSLLSGKLEDGCKLSDIADYLESLAKALPDRP